MTFSSILNFFGYRYSNTPYPAESFELPALWTRNPKPTITPISLRSAYVDVGRVIHEPISQDIAFSDNLADLFTKPLPHDHHRLLTTLNINVPQANSSFRSYESTVSSLYNSDSRNSQST